MSTSVKIVTDSACDLPEDLIVEHGIAVVPLSVRFGDDEYVDRLELSNEAFWSRMATSSTLPSTAAPSPGAFEEAFRAALSEGCRSIVCINISSKLSATHQAAVTAAKFVEDAIEVHTVDSAQVTIAHGSLVLEAARLAAAGDSAEGIVTKVKQLRDNLHLYGVFDTLENLKKGGRIGKASALFGSLLSVKPILVMREGELLPESRQRTRRRSLEYLADLVRKQAPIDHVAVAHSNAPDLEQFLELLAPVVAREDIVVAQIGPVIGTHGGPGLIAISFATTS